MANFLTPEKIVQSFDIESGDHIADIGAGHGYFTIPLAKAAGDDGKVYAIDIQKSVLEIIRARAKAEYLLNIEIFQKDLEQENGSGIQNDFLDFVLVANILFQHEKKTIVFREAYRILRKGGRMAVIDWNEEASPLGPPKTMRVRKEDVRLLAQDAGFEFEKEFDAGNYHYGLLFRKS